MFTIIKVQRTNPVTYLLEDYHAKTVVAFYERSTSVLRVASRYSSGVQKVLHRKRMYVPDYRVITDFITGN